MSKFVKRELEITSLNDQRLMIIDPTKKGFFDEVLNYPYKRNERILDFIELVKKVQEAGIEPFYAAKMDPSIRNNMVVFTEGNYPAVGYSDDEWKKMAKKMPAVEDRNWYMGSHYQYYASLVQLINELIKTGYDSRKAMEKVVVDSKDLGHFHNSEGAKHNFEKTGSRVVCGRYDLANTCKIVSRTNEEGTLIVGGCFVDYSFDNPLAHITHGEFLRVWKNYSLGWLVL